MTAVFLKLLTLSGQAALVTAAVLAVRLVLRRAPRRVLCLLWALVALRLVLPFQIISPVSLQPETDPVVGYVRQTAPAETPEGTPAVPAGSAAGSTEKPSGTPAAAAAPKKAAPTTAEVLSWVWLAGMAAMAGYLAASWLRLRRQVAEAVPAGGYWRCGDIDSPFVLGFFRPRIYLPAGLAEEDVPHVLAHERTHIRRRDHWVKPLAFLLLAVYWFNPLLWAAYILLCRDIEGACDEAALSGAEPERRAAYSRALVACAGPRHLAACPVAFGESDVPGRVKRILSYRRPAFWVLLAAAAAAAAVAVCLLTAPVDKNAEQFISGAILVQNTQAGDLYPAQAHRIFGLQRTDTGLTAEVVYAYVAQRNGEEYVLTEPALLQFTGEDGSYTLVSFVPPYDNAYYQEGAAVHLINAHFPLLRRAAARRLAADPADLAEEARQLSRTRQQQAIGGSVTDAQALFDQRVTYIGDAPAVGGLLETLGFGQWGSYEFALSEGDCPAGEEPGPNGVVVTYRQADTALLTDCAPQLHAMGELLVALVDNARWFQCVAEDADGTQTVITHAGGGDEALMDAARKSPEGLERLQTELARRIALWQERTLPWTASEPADTDYAAFLADTSPYAPDALNTAELARPGTWEGFFLSTDTDLGGGCRTTLRDAGGGYYWEVSRQSGLTVYLTDSRWIYYLDSENGRACLSRMDYFGQNRQVLWTDPTGGLRRLADGGVVLEAADTALYFLGGYQDGYAVYRLFLPTGQTDVLQTLTRSQVERQGVRLSRVVSCDAVELTQ